VALHLIKLCVGIDDVGQLRRAQARRLHENGRVVHFTRMTPRRGEELLEGGSLYWVIRRKIQVRQRLRDIDRAVDADGRPYTQLVLEPELVRVLPTPHRAFQGWRYLRAEDAPPDLEEAGEGAADMPEEMVAELRELGLL
jgi:hypothetical protein